MKKQKHFIYKQYNEFGNPKQEDEKKAVQYKVRVRAVWMI